MSNGTEDRNEQLARLWSLQATANKLILDGKRDPEKLANILQAFKEGSVHSSFDKAPLDTIIRVDRSVRPVYPDWAKEVIHPELETVGPAEYDLAKQVELWFHDDQKNDNGILSTDVYDHLKSTDSLKNCLGLHDAVAIQSKGIAVFRKLFRHMEVFCWKSVVQDDDGYLNVSYIYEDGDEVAVGWHKLGTMWHSSCPAARFAS